MGNYKSRPQLSCADELKKRISEGYAIVRSRLNDDIRPRFDARSPLHISCFQGTLAEFEEQLLMLSPEERVRDERIFSLLQQICIGVSEQQAEKITLLLEKYMQAKSTSTSDDVKSAKNQLLRYCTRNGFSALHVAIYKGELRTVEALLKANANANLVTSGAGAMISNVPPPLHLAAMGGNAEIALALIHHGADICAVDFVRFSALHCAVYFGSEQVVRCLLNSKADANSSGGVHDRPLHIASARPYPAIVHILLKAGADPSLADDEGNTALHFAAKTGHVEVIEALLHAVISKIKNSESRNNSVSSQKELAMRTNIYGDTPLHVACYASRFDAVKCLLTVLDNEALNMENVFSETPFMASCTSGRSLELVGFLMRQSGVDPNYQAQDGHTALHSACYHGHLRIVQYLLDNGADQSLTAKAIENPLNGDSDKVSTDGMPKAGNIASKMSALTSRLNNTNSIFLKPTSKSMMKHLLAKSSTSTLNDNEKESFLIQQQQNQPQTPILWAYEKGHDQIVALLKHHANKHSDSDVCSEYSSGDSSYTPLPSPLGRLRSMTKEKTKILQLRAQLPNVFHANLADFELKEIIGHGSFGKVYRGVLIRNGRTVAIKRYKALAFGAKTEVDLFCREVLILSRLKHVNIISFIGACMDDPSQFAIITEFVSAGSLFSLLHVQKRIFEMALKLSVGIDVARGMHYLHDLATHTVIHRDLNSHNILLHAERGRAVIVDFGESRFTASDEHTGSDAQMTKQPGNLRWMAPEVFTQCSRYNNKIDVFSYALVIWEIYAAELPFAKLKPAAAAAEMAYKHNRPELPTEPTSQFPLYIIELLKMAWHTDPFLRPSFAQILQLIEPHGPSEDMRATLNLSTDIAPDIRIHLSRNEEINDECEFDHVGISAAESGELVGEDDAEICDQQKTVSQLKTRWEKMSSNNPNWNDTVNETNATNKPITLLGNPNSIVERLRGQLDNHGYVSQAARAVAAAKSATQLRDSLVLARSANIAERQSALTSKGVYQQQQQQQSQSIKNILKETQKQSSPNE